MACRVRWVERAGRVEARLLVEVEVALLRLAVRVVVLLAHLIAGRQPLATTLRVTTARAAMSSAVSQALRARATAKPLLARSLANHWHDRLTAFPFSVFTPARAARRPALQLARPAPRRTFTRFRILRDSAEAAKSAAARAGEGAAAGAEAQSRAPRSLSERLKHLFKTQGWPALVVYLALSAVDFGLTFLLIYAIGADRVREAEDWVLDKLAWRRKSDDHHAGSQASSSSHSSGSSSTNGAPHERTSSHGDQSSVIATTAVLAYGEPVFLGGGFRHRDSHRPRRCSYPQDCAAACAARPHGGGDTTSRARTTGMGVRRCRACAVKSAQTDASARVLAVQMEYWRRGGSSSGGDSGRTVVDRVSPGVGA